MDSKEISFTIPSSLPKSKKFLPLTDFSLSDTVLHVASRPENSFELSVEEFEGSDLCFLWYFSIQAFTISGLTFLNIS